MLSKKLNVLLLEDNQKDAALIRRMLDGAFNGLFHLDHVVKLSEAINFLSLSQADLILLDLNLPDSRGLTGLTSLQTAFPHLPIVALTGAQDNTLGARALEQGALDCLVKDTIDSEKLVQAIRHAVERQHIQSRLAQAMEEVSSSNRLLKQVLSSISDGVVIVNEKGIIQSANTAAASLFNTHEEALVGRPLGFPATGTEKKEIQIERGGQPIHLEMHAVKLEREEAGATLVFLRNTTEQKQLQERLFNLAHRDGLTGLANRALLMDHLKKSIAGASRSNGLIAVLYLDIDRLARINNTLGHPMGNLLLKEIAKRLKVLMRGGDDTARVGGDEFAIILSDLTRVETIPNIAQKIIDRLGEPYSLEGGHEWGIALSIGISLYPNDARDPESLLEYAEMALHRAKRGGKNNYHYYSHTLQEGVKERLAVETNLRSALHEQNLFVVYQPIVSLTTGYIVGMEVLLRLKHENMGIIAPSRFIPVAEETGMIVKIGTGALLKACTQNKAWQEMGLPPLVMAVNLSAIQLKEANFLSMVNHVLRHTGLSPQYLELELTESLMQDTERTLRVLSSLHEIGVLSSIDDFGTGYSSLSHLRQFPFNTLKIDISFIRNMMNHQNNLNLVKTIITMAHNFELRTIAEGVETLEQLQTLQSLGCDEVQGFFVSKPLSADAATKRLSERKPFF